MALFVIGDLHLALGEEGKQMDVFQGWQGYLPKLETNWRNLVGPEDTVILPGDISWAMSLEGTKTDFTFIENLPGKKIILKGNHDYWWSTLNKMNRYLEENNFKTITILNNNSTEVDGVSICGTRGWMNDVQGPDDIKIQNREVARLRMSLDSATCEEKLVFLHYPPVYPGHTDTEFTAVLKEYGIKKCFYAHLHGNFMRYAVQGEIDGIEYRLTSADGLQFCPYKIF